jgi:hypothetical protein
MGQPMKTQLFAAMCLLAAACTHEASRPSSAMGQTEAQALGEFPRQIEPPPGARMAATSTFTAEGTQRFYESRLSYEDTVGFFDRTLLEEGCETIRRSTTKTSTVWVAQCSSGDRVHVSVRQTEPTTVEVLEPLR